jgi:hypothetical protein
MEEGNVSFKTASWVIAANLLVSKVARFLTYGGWIRHPEPAKTPVGIVLCLFTICGGI